MLADKGLLFTAVQDRVSNYVPTFKNNKNNKLLNHGHFQPLIDNDL